MRWHEPVASARLAKADRPKLAAALDFAWTGDSLVVWRLDRLGRSLSDLIALVRRMEESGVQLHSLTEGIDTSTTNGKLTFHLFAALRCDHDPIHGTGGPRRLRSMRISPPPAAVRSVGNRSRFRLHCS
jgi:hypothetical protein